MNHKNGSLRTAGLNITSVGGHIWEGWRFIVETNRTLFCCFHHVPSSTRSILTRNGQKKNTNIQLIDGRESEPIRDSVCGFLNHNDRGQALCSTLPPSSLVSRPYSVLLLNTVLACFLMLIQDGAISLQIQCTRAENLNPALSANLQLNSICFCCSSGWYRELLCVLKIVGKVDKRFF